MPKLRVLSGQEVCKIMAQHGFVEVRRKGSHIIMQRKEKLTTITVPVPDHQELRVATLTLRNKMTDVTRHMDTPSQRPPATAIFSAPAVDAVTSDTDKDLYTDLTDVTDFYIGKNPCFPCVSVYQKHYA